jgi:hypothetical protein
MRNVNELRNFLLDCIKEVKSGTLDVPKAQAICSMTNSVINLTKLEMLYNGDDVGVEFMNDIKEEDENLDETLREIEEKNKQPYIVGQ